MGLELPASGDAPAKGVGWSGLTQYVIAATLVRVTDGGAIVAVVLLVTMQGGSGNVAGFRYEDNDLMFNSKKQISCY